VMGVFKFAASLCEDLSRMIRIFGWGDEHSQQKRPLDWLGQKMMMAEGRCYMGFCILRLLDQVLVVCQRWRLVSMPDSLSKTTRGSPLP
jgi:hypothetical protein